jgi:hypothetical protein
MRSGLQHNQSLALDRAGMTVFRDMSLRSMGVWNSSNTQPSRATWVTLIEAPCYGD